MRAQIQMYSANYLTRVKRRVTNSRMDLVSCLIGCENGARSARPKLVQLRIVFQAL